MYKINGFVENDSLHITKLSNYYRVVDGCNIFKVVKFNCFPYLQFLFFPVIYLSTHGAELRGRWGAKMCLLHQAQIIILCVPFVHGLIVGGGGVT